MVNRHILLKFLYYKLMIYNILLYNKMQYHQDFYYNILLRCDMHTWINVCITNKLLYQNFNNNKHIRYDKFRHDKIPLLGNNDGTLIEWVNNYVNISLCYNVAYNLCNLLSIQQEYILFVEQDIDIMFWLPIPIINGIKKYDEEDMIFVVLEKNNDYYIHQSTFGDDCELVYIFNPIIFLNKKGIIVPHKRYFLTK